MKKLLALLLSLVLLIGVAFAAPPPPEITAPSAVLMEKETGTVLAQVGAHNKLPPASVTKVMTLLLVMEALDSGKISMEDQVTVSPFAASMGGSQVYLEPGEQMSMDDMLKAVVIASGNDASVALAEHVAGSAEGFVSMMNARAKELGMNDTTFVNCTGLDAPGHVTSAYDIALMSRELLRHEKIKKYTTIWMDSLRDGAFGLANTNKLLRSYNGITGLKTGSTSVAKYCMSATAERDGMELIATVLAADTSKHRFSDASRLLDYGFANFALYDSAAEFALDPVPVLLGVSSEVPVLIGTSPKVLVEKAELGNVKRNILLAENVKAPVEAGQKLGEITVTCGDKTLTTIPLLAQSDVARLTSGAMFWRLLQPFFVR